MGTELMTRVTNALLSMQRQCWEQGVAGQALLYSGQGDWATLFAHDSVVRQIADGRPGMVEAQFASTDPGSHAEILLHAARVTGDESYTQAATRLAEWLLHTAPRAKDGTLYHNTDAGEMWSDSLYMLPPTLGVYGRFDEAMRQIHGLRQRLWLADRKMYAHIWSEDRGEFRRKACWGGGNGWAAAGFARLIGMMPADMAAEREELIGYLKEVLEGCVAHQRPDGLFHDVVDDPSTFVETNLAQMLAFAIYHSVAGGWLDESWLPAAHCMREGALAKVDALGFVQGACGSPHFDHSGTSTEAQSFTLMMETAAAPFVG